MKVVAFLTLALAATAANAELKPLRNIVKGGRIVGGTVAQQGEFPFICAIYKTAPSGTFFGAGSLITTEWVMTAAQLVDQATQVEMHFGSNVLTGDDANRVIVTSTSWIINENWNATSLWSDIALVRLPQAIATSTYIQPIPVAPFGCCYIYPGNTVRALGWGQTSNTGDIVNELQYTSVTFIDQFDCKDIYGDAVFNSMICAVPASGNDGICYGDIGGPLIAPVNYWLGDYPVVAGISSWMSSNGCESTEPNGFTRADSYEQWVQEKLAANP